MRYSRWRVSLDNCYKSLGYALAASWFEPLRSVVAIPISEFVTTMRGCRAEFAEATGSGPWQSGAIL